MICHPSMTQRALQLHPHLGRSRTEFIHRKAWEQSWLSALAWAPAHANLLTSRDTIKKKQTKISSENPLQPSVMLTKAKIRCLLSHSLPNNIWRCSKHGAQQSSPPYLDHSEIYIQLNLLNLGEHFNTFWWFKGRQSLFFLDCCVPNHWV